MESSKFSVRNRWKKSVTKKKKIGIYLFTGFIFRMLDNVCNACIFLTQLLFIYEENISLTMIMCHLFVYDCVNLVENSKEVAIN